jgi:hypothetical protein
MTGWSESPIEHNSILPDVRNKKRPMFGTRKYLMFEMKNDGWSEQKVTDVRNKKWRMVGTNLGVRVWTRTWMLFSRLNYTQINTLIHFHTLVHPQDPSLSVLNIIHFVFPNISHFLFRPSIIFQSEHHVFSRSGHRSFFVPDIRCFLFRTSGS